MTDWHIIHLGQLALSGAALLTIEATAVTPEGRITYGDTGFMVQHQRGGDGACAGEHQALVRHTRRDPARTCRAQGFDRKALARRRTDPARRGQNGWQAVAPSPIPFSPGGGAPTSDSLISRGWIGSEKAFADAAFRAARLELAAVQTAWRPRISTPPVPVSALEPALGSIWRQSREPDALPPRSV